MDIHHCGARPCCCWLGRAAATYAGLEKNYIYERRPRQETHKKKKQEKRESERDYMWEKEVREGGCDYLFVESEGARPCCCLCLKDERLYAEEISERESERSRE